MSIGIVDVHICVYVTTTLMYTYSTKYKVFLVKSLVQVYIL